MQKSMIYTRTGDKGSTSLVGGHKVSKTDVRLEAYGTVDELSAYIGYMIHLAGNCPDAEILRFVQNKLFVIGSYLATDISFIELRDASLMKDEDVVRLENRIDELDSQLSVLNNFILPGGTVCASFAHICRTVCRRAERRICEVALQYPVDETLLRFVNRFSDYLFVFARFNNNKKGGEEIFWDKSCK